MWIIEKFWSWMSEWLYLGEVQDAFAWEDDEEWFWEEWK